ncbi:MAG TPA: 5'/3'-nucleotidase SurE, partial [Urbifossiella sp.]|nr:5'/3'-nucleotidase SurE [Urbifossiella sp.]
MKLLVTNDDGIDADGIAALLVAARTVGEPVVVAPAGPQSGVSHAVTTGTAVRVEERDGGHAVFGTPADCVRVGLLHVVPDARFVLAGVNHGGNLGADVYY